MRKKYLAVSFIRASLFAYLGSLASGALFLLNLRANADGWTLAQFSSLDPVLTFETGSTALPNISGIHFLTPSDATGTRDGFGMQALGNVSTVGGYTSLEIGFDQPQQAVGAYVFPFRLDVPGVTETVYDRDNNVIESAAVVFDAFPQDYGYAPIFLGLGEKTTNIFRVEWKYTSPGGFGVDNVIYHPGLPIAMSNVQSSSDQIFFSFPTLPGRTNVVQSRTDIVEDGWTTLTNLIFLGDGGVATSSLPTTNVPAAYFRIKIE